MSPSARRTARRLTALAVAALSALTVAATTTGGADASPGSDRFIAGVPYDGEFASPHVLRADGRWWAYATTTDGNNLPVESSTDLRTWYPREPLSDYWRYTSWKGYHDALPRPASWAASHVTSDGVRRWAIWAPTVARMGGRYTLSYAAMVDFSRQRLCISIAHSDRPDGVFTDTTKRPIVCSSDPHGSIDPHLQKAGTRNFLIWKNAGMAGSHPTRIWARRLNGRTTAFMSGTRAHKLLATARPWEGNVIEAPAMVRYARRWYLFYSGNSYLTDRYATGYAICDTVLGPCRRATRGPLLATGNGLVGPGGATPFVDRVGRLRLAYHAWDAGRVGYPKDPSTCRGTEEGCNQRRMHIATLSVGSGGRLSVERLG
jgi:hypothetical protein